jgi:phosphoribosylformylglycinamidine synthase
MWQFSEVIDGMSEACTAFGTPVTGGNVSFYNETFGDDIYPTPVIGIVGLVEDLDWVTPSAFRDEGDVIFLIEPQERLTGKVNLDDERAVQNVVSESIRARLVKSAHDLSEGGLAVGLAECCFSTLHRSAIGAQIEVPSRMEACRDLFGDYSSRIILSTNNPSEIERRAVLAGLKCFRLGVVAGSRLIFNYEGTSAVDISIGELESAWRQGLPDLL